MMGVGLLLGGYRLQSLVGASLLAKNINDHADLQNERGVLKFFASKLAPTVMHCPLIIHSKEDARLQNSIGNILRLIRRVHWAIS